MTTHIKGVENLAQSSISVTRDDRMIQFLCVPRVELSVLPSLTSH